MAEETLEAIAKALVAPGKGILAADESTPTLKKRFDGVGVESTTEARRAYRELLFSTKQAAPYIGGVILFDETIRQSARDGTPFPELLRRQPLDRGLGANRHEDWRLDRAVRRLQTAQARGAVRCENLEANGHDDKVTG